MKSIKRILCVDDSPIELKKIKAILSPKYDVVTANTGLEAIRFLQTEIVDLVFMDIVMPEMDGFTACRQIVNNSETRHTPVVFVTSKDQMADKVWGELQGAKDYIVKPYEEKQILDIIKKLEG